MKEELKNMIIRYNQLNQKLKKQETATSHGRRVQQQLGAFGSEGTDADSEDDYGGDGTVTHPSLLMKEISELAQKIAEKKKQVEEMEEYHNKVTIAKTKCGKLPPHLASSSTTKSTSLWSSHSLRTRKVQPAKKKP
jgi:phage shock protein A